MRFSKKKAANKYGAKRTEVDGIKFDSRAEATRYLVLKRLLDDGIIENLERQVRYDVEIDGRYCWFYKSDFEYEFCGKHVIEDVKGEDTPASKAKRPVVEAVYGVEIKIVPADRVHVFSMYQP